MYTYENRAPVVSCMNVSDEATEPNLQGQTEKPSEQPARFLPCLHHHTIQYDVSASNKELRSVHHCTGYESIVDSTSASYFPGNSPISFQLYNIIIES